MKTLCALLSLSWIGWLSCQPLEAAVFTNALTIAEGDHTYDEQDIVIGGATVVIDGAHRFTSMLLTNGGVLTHSACTRLETHKLDLTISNGVLVDATSKIDASGKGYLAGRTTGSTDLGGSTSFSGGSYGGLGGAYRNGVVNGVYGDATQPNDWGSGGGVGANQRVSAGGGLIRVTANSLRLDGQLLADGEVAQGGNHAGGSGGGINLTVSTIIGNGRIRAAGANGAYGAGGGGRIAIYALNDVVLQLSEISARGETGDGNGGSGTVHIAQTTAECLPPPPGLVSWWPGEGDATDIFGGHNGTLQNTASFASGRVGDTFSFDGISGYIEIPTADDLNPVAGQAWTIEGWIRPTTNTFMIVASKGNDLGVSAGNGRQAWHFELRFDLPGSPLEFEVFDNSSRLDQMQSTVGLATDSWQHVAVAVESMGGPASGYHFYINGVDAGLHVVTDMNVGSITTTEPLRIGAAKDRADVIRGFFKGEIDEFAIFKRALASNEIATLYSAGTAGMCKPVCTPRASSLVAWWPGDGNANDIIGANNGVLERGATATVSGKVGQCFSLDGVDDRIRILASPSLNVGAGNGFTIEGWIFLNDSTSGHSVVEWNNDAGVPGVRFWIVAPGSLYADIRDTSSSRHIVAFSPNTIATNVFQHIALSYDKRTGQAKLFLNGRQLVAQNLGIFTPQTSYDVYLGRQIDDIPTSFAGKLDEIAIYNNALSSAEITAIYAASSAGKCLPNTTPAEHSVLFVNVHGESYDADGANFYKTLTTTAAKSTFVNLDANGKVATLIRSNRYDQIWVFDLSSGLDDYPADWQAIGDWFNALTNAAIICDGRTISSYWFGQWQGEGRMLTLNYYENLKRQGGGIMLGTDDDNYVSGINSLNDRIGVERFHGNFNLDFIPIDMASPLMNFPNNLGSRLHDNSSPSQTPFGLQPNGRILYSVAWHSGDTNTPGISSTIRGGVGFRIQITSPANGLQVNEEAPVAFEVGQTDGSPPFSYTWESDRDGMLGTGSALAVSNLSTGPHRITVIGTDAARGADSASILINVVFLTPTVSVALQPGSDTGASNSDNITTNRAPIFEVTINKRGSIEFDSTDDGVADDLRANLQAGTHIFLTPPLTDGRHTVTARFVPLLGSSIQTSLTMVVDSRPPLISNLAVTVTPLPSIVTWNTDEPSTSQSDYGLTTNYGRTTSLNSSFVTQHSVALTGLLPGTQYHFRVLASDLAGNEAESSDQAFSTPLTPDLQVTNLTVSPASLKSGSEVTIAWSDINTGLGQTTASWYDRVVVSNLALGLSLVATNIFFDSVLHGNLGSGGSRSNICRLRLPDGFPGAGTLQFIVTADITNTLIEYNQSGTAEDNNSTITNRNATLAPYPDLLISDISSPATAQPGQPIPITWTIVNQGTADAVGVRSDVVSLSTDSQIGNDQVLQAFDLGRTIPVGQSIVVTQSLILPGGLPGDRYFVIAVNSSNRVFELIPTNNTTISSRPITVLSSDLVVQSVVGPSSAQLGQSLPIAWSVQNVGNATANVNWNDRVYLSTSSNSLSGAEVLATYPAVQTLTRGSLYTNSQSVFLELTSSKPPGIYYLVVAADYSSLQPEANESNNIGFRPINLISPPLPDLAITSITVPSAVFPGQTVPVRWAVTNRGKGIANGGWVESLQLSTDALLGNDQPLTSIAFTNSILVGEFVTRTQQVTFPATSASGELFLLVQVDGQNSIVEEDEANNFAFSTNAISVPSALTLYSSVTQISENSADPNIQATISRNGNLSGSLTVTVTSSDTNKLVAPSTVTISAGQSSAAFNLTLRQDGIVDSDKLVTVTATSAGFIPGMGTITVINTDLPRLSLSVEVPSIPEGFTTPVTVMRDDVSDQELTVTLVSSSPGSLLVPGTVSIPAKSNALTFAVLAIEDTIVQQLRTFTITASAGQHDSASAHLSIVDNDLPAITLELASTNISEGAGILATVGTIRRSTADGQIFVAVGSSDTTAALVPPSIGLDPGQLESTFPIGAVDDFVVDGPQTVTISAIVVDSLAGQPLGNTISQTLVVTDDDGPTLTLSVARKVVPEGRSVATMGTVRRNTPTNPALVVSLASSDTTEATAPVIVTIPSGESSASFDISTVDDGITDGSQRVTISATASGYVDGVDSFVVSDTDLPDLVGSDISAPGSIESEANFSITVRVSNQGLAPTRTNFLTRIYLGTDPLSGKGNLVGEFDTQTTLAAGQFFEQVMALTAPLVLGQYWVTVDTDVGRDVEEIIESNNFKITTTPISVEPAYRATVQIDTQATLPGRPILLRGRALRSASDQPLPGVRVNLNVIFGGTARVITVITDDDGNFAASFTPLPDEAGSFTIIASHPGESNPLNNGQGNTALITLMGMKLEIPNVYQTLVEHETWVGEFTLRNLAETPLTGLHAEITQKPDSISVASLSLERGDALLPNGSNTLAIQLVAENATIPNGEILVRVTSDQGVVEEGRILISINRQQAHLVVSISPLEASMVRGKTRTVEFQLGNAGAAASGPIALLLPQTPWLASPSGQTLLSIPSGGSVTVSLSLNPGSDLPLTVYQGSLVLSSDSSQVSIPFRFRCVSESTADLSVEVVDEFFYYAAGSPKLTNALVRLLDAFSSQEISRGTSDTNGLVLFSPLAEGPYTVEVSAKDHTSYRNTVVLEAGVRNQHQAFLSRQVVTYAWTVEPVTIEERVTISVEATFEANVPIPVIVVSPTLIDLSPLTRLGQTMQVDVKMTNHGLIAWQGVHIGFENHPIYEIKALIQDVGIIAAHSEVTVPLLITYKSEAAFRAAPPCNVYGQVSGYYPCGGRQVTGATTIQGYANCTPSPNPPSRPLSNPHQPQPPNPSQPTTAILPPTPTPVQLSIQPPCSCSVSISGASQSNAGHMVSLTASGNPPGGTYRWSVVGPGVALSQSGSTARLNATSVGTLTVHVNYRPPGVTSAGGSCTADHTVTISNIIETQTVATTPANRARLKLGIGEEVVCRIVPPTSATWSVSGGGQLSSSSGSTTTFVASKSPSTSTVNARIGSSDVTVTFTVVAPSGFNTTIQSSPGFGVLGDSQIGQRTIYNVEVVPTDVSFYNAEFQEYFQVTPPLSWTWPDRTTQTFGPSPIAWSVGYDNLTTDDIRDGPYPKTRLYSGGAFHDFSYTISWMEQYKNELAKWITFVADETTVTDFSGTSFQCKTVNRGVAGLWQGPWR